MTSFWTDSTIDALAGCPPDALRWAAIAWRAGHDDGHIDGHTEGFRAGYLARKQAELAEWRPVAEHVLTDARRPTHTTTVARRVPSPAERCTAPACGGRCSRCIATEAWEARCGRPYLGVQREAELARGAA